MYLNLFENHFSYISKFKSYAKKYQCPNCTRFITRTDNLKRHMKKCQIEVEEIFIGGKCRNKKTVFELLEDINIHVPKEDRFDEYFTTYDFEALQAPIDEEHQGRSLHYEHVPATVSICSSVPEHTEPVHIRSRGEPQELVDDFVQELLKVQTTREVLLTTKYQPYLNELTEKKEQLESLLGIEDNNDDAATAADDDDDETNHGNALGKKRKKKRSKTTRSKRPFLDTEALLSGDDDSPDEAEDDEDEGDIENLINDESDVEENDANFYRTIDNELPGPSTAAQPPPPPPPTYTDEEITVAHLRLKKVKRCLSKLKTYIGQHIILGFNSQKYDIPLIRRYLPASLIKFDGTPKQIIKKMNGYMVIATPKLKFLDILNYLAAGTSLKQFYDSFRVSTPKGFFPYQWFDSLDKLDYVSLPETREHFRSILTTEEFQSCHDAWERQGMTTFADYVRYYNNADVIGFVEAVQKMLANERNNGLDMFKVSVSLPGLTQRYLFSKLENDYFVGFGTEHKHLAKELRDNITGGPSIIFHRYHERLKTLIKGIKDNFCRCVKGFDANSLYLHCMGQIMPTGWYSVQEESDGYKKQARYSREAIQWLQHVMRTKNIRIRHAENGGEHRIDNYAVDGFDEENNTVYEYHGCFWHKHHCNTWYDPEKWSKTVKRDQAIRDAGFTLVTITSCEWFKMPEAKDWYPPPEENDEESVITKEDILDDVLNDRIFGFIKVWIHVPAHLIQRFSEFPPLFKNTEIKLIDIGDHMKKFCEDTGRKAGIKRSLISSMHAEGILLLTPLLKWYLQQGLVVTRIERVISYNGKTVFEGFMTEVCDDRRRADLGGTEAKMKGEASKLKGNCSYGHTVMNKSKHTNTSFAKEKNLQNHTKNPLLKTYEELNEDIYEVIKDKKKIVHDLPLQIGVAVYSYAKLRMLEFWNFINTYLVNDLYQFMEMDTDSLYIAFARDTIDECVKPELREQWKTEKWKWFCSEDNDTMKEFEGQLVTLKQWDKRTPGKFKVEYDGEGMACLNSKVYIIWGEVDGDGRPNPKCSCKGCQQKRNELLIEHFLNVLMTKEAREVENAGFIRDTSGVIKTYTQKKRGMSYFYGKRKVLDDGVSTTHLDI